MREELRQGYEQFLAAVGWLGVVVGLGLLATNVVLHLGYSPFQHPGATPGPDRLDLLRMDGVRWLATAITGSICGVQRAPRKRSRFERGPGAAVAYPLSVLMAVVVMAAGSTVCWFYWMMRLPGGDRMQNALFAAGYFVLPATLLLTFAAALATRPRG